MRELPVDYFGHPGKIQANGRAIYDVTLYQVKTPAETKYPWDYFKPIEVLPEALSQPGSSGLPGVGMAIEEQQGPLISQRDLTLWNID
jgi:branched-chain amino acid transport system substrate-binding protein